MEKTDFTQQISSRPKIKRNSKAGFLQNGHRIRKAIQYGFLIACLLIGIQFYFWYRFYITGGQGMAIPRPPGAEGFLPLSALIGLKYWIFSGIFNPIHPAALVIFLAIILMSLAFKKSFCGYICPVGLISEWHWKLGRKLFGKKFVAPYGWKMPRWIDYSLRSIKYMLLAFFVHAILIKMNSASPKSFIYSPYNKIADVKMLLFFLDISRFAFGVILIVMVASLFISNFWCRYLCPYGGLLGLLSFLSPVKIYRNKSTCTNCKACTRVCPAMINVHAAGWVHSDECMSCMECVRACPVEDTLYPAVAVAKKELSPRAVAFGVLIIFFAFYLGGQFTGHWKNNISSQEYMYHIKHMSGLEYNHIR